MGVCRSTLKPWEVWEGLPGKGCYTQLDSGKSTIQEEMGDAGNVYHW
jgi:hypothetical protein